MESTLNATILAREDATERLALLWIGPDAGRVQAFEPGQFVQVGLPRGEPDPGGRTRFERRSYSIASSPLRPESVELYLARVDDGRFSPRLWGLQPGDRLWMDPEPKGRFVLGEIAPESELVLVATGTGLAPFVSMLRRWRGAERWSRVTLIHGVRLPEELTYREELEERARQDELVRYLPVVSRAPAGSSWTGIRGRVQLALEPEAFHSLSGRALDPGRCHVFLCGNPDMIRDVRALLEPRGFQAETAREPGTLHFERYW
jgi:ferredoxin--NADP+ reductase